MSIFHDQHKFMAAAGNAFPGCSTDAMEHLAINLMQEEFYEFKQELGSDGVNDIKEALDLIYVTAQYLNTRIGPDMVQRCWDALQENNMSKCIDGKLVKREDGKVLKPEGYKKLDLMDVLFPG